MLTHLITPEEEPVPVLHYLLEACKEARRLEKTDSAQQEIVQSATNTDPLSSGQESKYEQDVLRKHINWLTGENGLLDFLRLVYPEESQAIMIQPLVNKAINNPFVLLSDAQLLEDMTNTDHKIRLLTICIMFFEEQKLDKIADLLTSFSEEQKDVRRILVESLQFSKVEDFVERLSELTLTATGLTEKQHKDVVELNDFVVRCYEAQMAYVERQGLDFYG